jgi:hypothetical protein
MTRLKCKHCGLDIEQTTVEGETYWVHIDSQITSCMFANLPLSMEYITLEAEPRYMDTVKI